MPSMFSITILWLSPIPSVSRPSQAAFTVRHCCAIALGWRGYVGTTDVPSSMRGTSRPTIASAVSASWPKMFGAQYDAKPSASACRASATTSSIVPSLMDPPNIPIRMSATVPIRPRRARSQDPVTPPTSLSDERTDRIAAFRSSQRATGPSDERTVPNRGFSLIATDWAGLVGAAWRVVRTQAMGNWNFRRHLGSGRRRAARRSVLDPRRRPPDLVRGRPPRRRRRSAPARCRPRTTAGGRSVPVQLQRVHGVDVRGVQGRLRSREHQLPVHRRRVAVPVGQRRRRCRRVPWLVRRHDRRDPRTPPEGEALAVGRRRQRRLPGVGDPLPGGRHERFATGRARVGTQRRRPELPLHRRNDGHAEGRHVASGRPGGEADRDGSLTADRRRHARRRPRHADRARCPIPARLPTDARHRQLSRARHVVRRRQHRHAHRSQLRRGRTPRHDRT